VDRALTSAQSMLANALAKVPFGAALIQANAR
jgi:hypothetical protein